MRPIVPFFQIGASFDAETLEAIKIAFDKACVLFDCSDDSALSKATIAAHICSIAGKGERDPKRMVASTVLTFDALTEMQVAASHDIVPPRSPAQI
jgi:hypothetical protein